MTSRDLPVGTVSFVFTDIEGSTRLLQDLGDAFPAVLERHNDLVLEAVKEHQGLMVKNEGDGFFLAFQSAVDAVRCAVGIQRAMAAEPWATPRPVRVRIGIHTGEGRLGGSDYVGIDVHRAARISDSGHGGQILLSETTTRLTEPPWMGRLWRWTRPWSLSFRLLGLPTRARSRSRAVPLPLGRRRVSP